MPSLLSLPLSLPAVVKCEQAWFGGGESSSASSLPVPDPHWPPLAITPLNSPAPPSLPRRILTAPSSARSPLPGKWIDVWRSAAGERGRACEDVRRRPAVYSLPSPISLLPATTSCLLHKEKIMNKNK